MVCFDAPWRRSGFYGLLVVLLYFYDSNKMSQLGVYCLSDIYVCFYYNFSGWLIDVNFYWQSLLLTGCFEKLVCVFNMIFTEFSAVKVVRVLSAFNSRRLQTLFYSRLALANLLQ